MIVHSHQPVGNPPDLFANITQRCYQPFLQFLLENHGFRLALHYSFPLLSYFRDHVPQFLEHLRTLIQRNQVEILGGGYGEPILEALPERDRMNQIELMQESLWELLGVVPQGFWIAERAWYSDLAETLARCGIRYTVLDEIHAAAAGIPKNRVLEPCWTEFRGRRIGVFFGSRKLRYLVPFRPWPHFRNFLQRLYRVNPDMHVCYADDGEKFGAWPGTYTWVYEQGWLDSFARNLKELSWLDMLLPSESLESSPKKSVVFIPSTTYDEMQEWLVDSSRTLEFNKLAKISQRRSPIHGFVRSADWQAFLHRYPESYLMYERMLEISSNLPNVAPDEDFRMLAEAQCNDAYWHGVFAGIYAPHLWRAVYERIAHLQQKYLPLPHLHRIHWLPNDEEQVHVVSQTWDLVINTEWGGEMVEWFTMCPCHVFGRVIRRRPEGYHILMESPGTTQPHDGIATIHDPAILSSRDMSSMPSFDTWPRYSGLILLPTANFRTEDIARNIINDPGQTNLQPVRPEVRTFQWNMKNHDITLDMQLVHPLFNGKRLWRIHPPGHCLELKMQREAPSGPWALEFQVHVPVSIENVWWKGSSGEFRESVYPGDVTDSELTLSIGNPFMVILEMHLVHPEKARWIYYPVFTVHLTEEGFNRTLQGFGVLVFIESPNVELYLRHASCEKGMPQG